MPNPANLIWHDGFDKFTVMTGNAGAVSETYIAAGGSIMANAAMTRFGYGQALVSPIIGREMNGSVGYPTVTCGFAAYLAGQDYGAHFASPTIWQLTDSGFNVICTVIYDGLDNRIYFCDSTYAGGKAIDGETAAGSGPAGSPGVIEFWNVPNTDEWYYIEISWSAGTSATTGSLTAKVNGVPVVNRSNLNVGTSNAVQWAMGGDAGVRAPWLVDDLYVRCDNAFLGDCRVAPFIPNAATATQDFTPSSGSSNVDMVDEMFSDGDSSFVYATSPGATDLYTVNAVTNFTPSIIYGVKVTATMRKSLITGGAGNRTAATVISSNGVVETGATVGLSQTYTNLEDVYGFDPNTGAAWTPAAVANVAIGMTIVS